MVTSSCRRLYDVIARLHDVDLFGVAEGKNFFGSWADDLAIVLGGHLDERVLAVDEAVRKHHRVVVLVQRSSGNEAEQSRLRAVSEGKRGSQVVKGWLTNCSKNLDMFKNPVFN